MPKSLYHPAEIATCRPNGFGLCQTHVTCGHVKESLHEANMQIERLRQEARTANANIERKQEEIASLRNACRMNEAVIAELRKEIEQHHMHEMGRLDVGEKDRIDRWRNEIREALRLYRLECKTSAEIKLESLLGEE